jgi:serine/threonine-protein kinase
VSTQQGSKLTRAGTIFGTPHYMSPEQAAGQPVDHRGDIYSFGVILYEMTSGKLPFDADNFMGILTQHMYKAPVPIRALVPAPEDVPPGLEAVILKCLSKRPEHRYQSLQELSEELALVRDGSIPGAVSEMMSRSGGFNVPADYFKKPAAMPPPMPASPDSGARRTPWPLYAGIAGVATAVGIVGAVFFANNGTSGARERERSQREPIPVVSVIQVQVPASASAAPALKEIVLAFDPSDAEAFQGEKSLGKSPLVIKLKPGEKVQLKIQREGYEPLEFPVDERTERQSVKLKPKEVKHAEPPKPSTTPVAPVRPVYRPRKPSGDVVDPWGN